MVGGQMIPELGIGLGILILVCHHRLKDLG
jgi:hypothetical protein